jgi:hypothetical protein
MVALQKQLRIEQYCQGYSLVGVLQKKSQALKFDLELFS